MLSERAEPLERTAIDAAPDGVLHHVQVQGREGDWSGSARIEGVGWAPYAGQPGVRGLGGSVAYDQDGGVLRLAEGPARFDWPKFRQPLDFRLGGTLGWWREGGLWTAGASDLRLRGADFGARLRAELHFPGEARRPRVDLAALVDPSPVPAAGKFWVQGKMPPTTIEWLDRALLDGCAGLSTEARTLASQWQQWQRAAKELATLMREGDRQRERLELLTHQLDELDKLGLAPGDYEKLEQEHDALANLGTLLQSGDMALDRLTENDTDNAARCVQQVPEKHEVLHRCVAQRGQRIVQRFERGRGRTGRHRHTESTKAGGFAEVHVGHQQSSAIRKKSSA